MTATILHPFTTDRTPRAVRALDAAINDRVRDASTDAEQAHWLARKLHLKRRWASLPLAAIAADARAELRRLQESA
jgi:hypothetical protein